MSRFLSVSLAVGLLAVSVLVIGADIAAAGDPYGETTTTTTGSPGDDPSCSVDQSQVEAGGVISGSVAGVEVGATLRFFLGGIELGTATAGSDGARAADDSGATTELTFSFAIPGDLEVGAYALVAVGATFNSTCVNPGGGTLVEVLGAGELGEGRGEDRGEGTGDGDDQGLLAFTGSDLLKFAIVAAVLVLIGYVLVSRSRARRLRVAGH